MKKIFSLLVIVIALLVSFTRREEDPVSRESLGEKLFLDPILSGDHTVSCASCHKPGFAFADTSEASAGVHGRTGLRNTPSIMNLRFSKTFFWDGRAGSLEEQVLGPIANPKEMNLPVNQAVARLKSNKKYRKLFQTVFHEDPTKQNLGQAIASFERTLETSDSPFDDWKVMENEQAVSEEVKKGYEIFNSKGKCSQCHFGGDFTNSDFRNVGLFNGRNLNDSGRMVITGEAETLGKFKTAGLRNIALTAPYMHNGMFRTLSEVIEFYNEPDKIVPDSKNRDSLLSKPLGLSPEEKKDLEMFLLSLTDKKFKK
ncbi:MAG TPA: cytochrome c peroxidase [Puia sp.]|nr:cytochrome c peroxidase [Puia sp.]